MNSIVAGTLLILRSIVDEWNVYSKQVDVVQNILNSFVTEIPII